MPEVGVERNGVEQVYVSFRPQHSPHLPEQGRGTLNLHQREGRHDVVESPIGNWQAAPVPGLELELPGNATQPARKLDVRGRHVQSANVGPNNPTPRLFHDPPVAALDE